MSSPRKTPVETIAPERAPSLGVALRYFLMGTLFLVLLFATVIWKAPMLVIEYRHNPVTLAVTHLFTLGFGASVVIGAIYQLMPVLLHVHLRSELLPNLHLGVHGVGVITMVVGFLLFSPMYIAVGGSLVVVGSLLLLANLVPTLWKVERWNRHGYFIIAAILFYIGTISLGVVLALNLRYGFMGELAEGVSLTAHLGMGLVGWFSLMIISVGLKLVPMFAPGLKLAPLFVASVGSALTLGVLAFLTALFVKDGWLLPGVLLMATAALAYTGGVSYTYLHRNAGRVDFSVRFAVTSAAVLSCLTLVALAGFGGLWHGRQLQAGLAMLFALGWIGGTILGMLLRIIPFMVWLHRFRNRLQKQEKIPFLHEMFHPALGWVAYLAWFLGSVIMALGMAISVSALTIVGAVLCLVGLGAFIVAVVQVLRQVPPGSQALFPSKGRETGGSTVSK
jgi:hypothetical protein